MEYSPPPFFRQGPSSFARFAFFAALSVVLLIADSRFKALEAIRATIATLIHPVQRAARTPGEAWSGAARFFASQSDLLRENDELKRRNLEAAAAALRARQLEGENNHMRRLLDTRESLKVESIAAEVIYQARDPFSRKVVLDKGTQAGIVAGQIVVDETGVLGQVTRTAPLSAEVTLLTDKDQAIPVQITRNGLRGVAYGTAQPGTGLLELRFMTANADVQPNDELVTSGIDGVYIPGLPVARVARVEREAGYTFAKIWLNPLAGIDRYAQVVVLSAKLKDVPPLPPPDDEGTKAKRGKRKFEERKSAEPTPAAAAAPGLAPALTPTPATAGTAPPASAAGEKK